MAIINRVPELVADKFGGKENVNLSQVQRDSKLDYRTVSAWMKNSVVRIDFPTLESWCSYLGVQPGDLFSYVPDGAKADVNKE